MLLLFTLTLFISSTLLFLIQPMVAKMVLPLLGGTPAVWNTSVLFFQLMLLAGYLYSHAVPTWLGVKRQAALHMILLAASLMALPVVAATDARPPLGAHPVIWLLQWLVMTAGVPFFVVATTSPLLQRWFVTTGHPSADDPYFLYAAGNAGSLLALIAYPALVEPTLRVADQSTMWTIGYVLLLTLIAGCALVLREPAGNALKLAEARSVGADRKKVTHGERAWWVILAFAPSSLMLGVTTFLTTDIAAMPLLWVLPLAIYLLTFILVFARRSIVSHGLMVRVLPILVVPVAVLMVFDTRLSAPVQIVLHLTTFFAGAMVCHGELARRRPAKHELTGFYLWLSIGGALGGVFNAVLAPLIFSSVAEYPIVLVLVCFLLPARRWWNERARDQWLDLGIPVAFGALVSALMFTFRGGDSKSLAAMALVFVAPAVVCFAFRRRPVRFALCVGALIVAGNTYMRANEQALYRGRSFFGVHRVIMDPGGSSHLLVHGGIVHGGQSLDPARRREPLMYFSRTGPIGDVFTVFSGAAAKSRVAVIGLGVGSLATYAAPGQRWTFFEIDPAIQALAENPRYFTFLKDSPAETTVTLGDARLSLEDVPDAQYGLLVVDAFSSDAIPMHLLTREALRLYLAKIDGSGLLAFHISNRYLDLQPLLGAMAVDAGLASIARDDLVLTADDVARGKSASRWVLMARRPSDFGALTADPRWHAIDAGHQLAWTDDFSNLLSTFRWRR